MFVLQLSGIQKYLCDKKIIKLRVSSYMQFNALIKIDKSFTV